MIFQTRKWIKSEDLNPYGTLFGGTLLKWIDEAAAIYAIDQLGNPNVATKSISGIEFVRGAREGDIIELGFTATAFGRTSITLRGEVRNHISRAGLVTIKELVFINMSESGEPVPHGRTRRAVFERRRYAR
jgi:acyl-CoA hydrolase